MFNNSYYTLNGNATIYLETENGWKYYNISQMQNNLNIEYNSTSNYLPTNNQIIQWATNILLS